MYVAFLLSEPNSRHGRAFMPLTPIPVQMPRIVTVAALARLQTQRLFSKPFGLVPLLRSALGKIRLPLTHDFSRRVHHLVQIKAQPPHFPFYPIVTCLFPYLQPRLQFLRLALEFFLPACAKCRDSASRSAGNDTSSAARSNAEMFSSSACGNTKLNDPSRCSSGLRPSDGSSSVSSTRLYHLTPLKPR